jgi:hypothetical protein
MGQVARSHRYELRFQAAFDDGEVYQTGPVRDLSTSGCFIETESPLPAGRKVRVIPLTTGDDELCELVGEVTRVEGNSGMGVRFLPMSDDVEIKVIKFCERRSAPAPTVPKKPKSLTDLKLVGKSAVGAKLPAEIVPGAPTRKAKPSPVDTADIVPLSTAEISAIDDDHDEKLRDTLNSIEGAPVEAAPSEPATKPAPPSEAATKPQASSGVVEKSAPVVVERVIERVVEVPATNHESHDELLAFGPRRSWAWAAILVAGGALVAAAFGAQSLLQMQVENAEIEADTARAVLAQQRDQSRALAARLATFETAAATPSPAPALDVELNTQRLVGDEGEVAIHLDAAVTNPGSDVAAVGHERVTFFLGVLKGRAQPLRDLNPPGTEGTVKWSSVQKTAADPALARTLPAGERLTVSRDLLVTPGKARVIGALVEVGLGEHTLTRVEMIPVPR